MSTTADELNRIISGRDYAFNAVIDKGLLVDPDDDIEDLAGYIDNIPSTGLGDSTGRDVIFIDYDGTEVYSYSVAGAMSLRTLPKNPAHSGLVAQGWNWTLDQIKYQIENVGGKVIVGQMYTTESGATELDIVLSEERKEPYLRFALNGSATIDWGDGSTETVTGTSPNVPGNHFHAYVSGGAYMIKVLVTSGKAVFRTDSESQHVLTMGSDYSDYANRVYSNTLEAVRVGNNTQVGPYGFYKCNYLKTITLPINAAQTRDNNWPTWGYDNAFSYCTSLASITFPVSENTVLTKNAVTYCRSLQFASISYGTTSIQGSAFGSCTSLREIAIPYGTEKFHDYVFDSCVTLEELIFPNTVTSAGTAVARYCRSIKNLVLSNRVTSINQQSFMECQGLKTITIPSSCTKMENASFQSCIALEEVKILNDQMVSPTTGNTFKSCGALLGFTIPNGFTDIQPGTFSSCVSIPSFTIPSGVTELSGNSFESCRGVKEYHLLPETPPTLESSVFPNISSDCIFYVPYSEDHSILNDYQTATNWSTYASRMQEEPQ